MRQIAILSCLCLVACQVADLALPPPPKQPEPGTVYGRVVYARPGEATRQSAAGAAVSILGTSLGTLAGSDGNFLLKGITQGSGTLLIRFDSDGDGRVDRQRSIELADIHAGPGGRSRWAKWRWWRTRG